MNSILFSPSGSSPNTVCRCQLIASPSRSGSVARYTLPAFLASCVRRAIISFLPGDSSYLGSKLSVIFTPSVLSGRSRMCPPEASTLYLPFKYFEMVFALEGDSTIIRSIDNTLFTIFRACAAKKFMLFYRDPAKSLKCPLALRGQKLQGGVPVPAEAGDKSLYFQRRELGNYFKRLAAEQLRKP